MTSDQLLSAIQSLGIPTVLILAGMYFGWRVSVWVAPRIDSVVTKHVAFIDSLQSAIQGFRETLVSVLETLRSIRDSQDEIQRDIGELKDHVGIHKQSGR